MQSNPIEFLKEAAIMHSIDNEHIVRLYGVVLDTDALMLVITNGFFFTKFLSIRWLISITNLVI